MREILAQQEIGQPRSILHPELHVERWLPKVRIDDKDTSSLLGKNDTIVNSRVAFSLSGKGAGDENRFELSVDGREQKRVAECSIGFGASRVGLSEGLHRD